MSDAIADEGLRPAIGLLELDSIVAGMVAGDAMVKASPVSALHTGTIHPGRYLVLVGGDTAAVEVALETGRNERVVDSLLLADVHPLVISAITSSASGARVSGDALGIVETVTVASAIVAADAGVKAADVALDALRLGDDLGGKAYALFAGKVSDVEAAVDAAVGSLHDAGLLVGSTVIPQLHAEMSDSLAAGLRFNHQLRDRRSR